MEKMLIFLICLIIIFFVILILLWYKGKKMEKKRTKEEYNYEITATKETKHYLLKIIFKNEMGTWDASIDDKKGLNAFLKDLKDDKKPILEFIDHEKGLTYINKDAIIYISCIPEKIKISECFADYGDSLGFMETLKIDRYKEIIDNAFCAKCGKKIEGIICGNFLKKPLCYDCA